MYIHMCAMYVQYILMHYVWFSSRTLNMPVAMMTSSNGNIFRVTGPLCWEFTGHRLIPLTKARDAGLWSALIFDLRLNKRLSKQSWGWLFETSPRPLLRHRNVDPVSCSIYTELTINDTFQITLKCSIWSEIRNQYRMKIYVRIIAYGIPLHSILSHIFQWNFPTRSTFINWWERGITLHSIFITYLQWNFPTHSTFINWRQCWITVHSTFITYFSMEIFYAVYFY